MTSFRKLSREKKNLYRLAYERGLTEFHWAAAQILLSVNGYRNAEGYLLKLGSSAKKPKENKSTS